MLKDSLRGVFAGYYLKLTKGHNMYNRFIDSIAPTLITIAASLYIITSLSSVALSISFTIVSDSPAFKEATKNSDDYYVPEYCETARTVSCKVFNAANIINRY